MFNLSVLFSIFFKDNEDQLNETVVKHMIKE
jgi:hypothetical protein